MSYEVGISSGIMGAAGPEEMHLYTGLARKAYYAITQGVKFVQIDLESIAELEQEGLKDEIQKVKEFGIEFAIHSETRAFGVEAAELDSAIEIDYRYGHERLKRILELSGEIGSKYLLIHASESIPLRLLGRTLQPSLLVDFFGNPLDEFVDHFNFLKKWLIGGDVEEVAQKIISIFEQKPLEERKKIKEEDIAKVVKVPEFLWKEIFNGRSFSEYFANLIRDFIKEREIPLTSDYEKLSEETRKTIDEQIKREIKEQIERISSFFLNFVRSRSLHYGPERFAYWIVAKYLEVEEPEWWNKFVKTSINYFAKADGKSVEEWCRENNIDLNNLSIDDDNFREMERLWVPAVAAKYIWGHFWQEKNWKNVDEKERLPDLKKILRKYKMPLIFESPMAQRGIEEFLRLPNPLHYYYLCKEIGEDITGIALDFEHVMSLRLKPEVIINLFPADGGRLVRVIHAGWPSPLAPAHLPLLLGSDQQLTYYKWLFNLRKKGFGKEGVCYLIYERGAAHVRESITTLRTIVEYLEKEVEPEKLPPEFFGTKFFASLERQLPIIRQHALDPLKGLLKIPEEEWTFFGTIARGVGKLEEWRREELK
jgi:hypothetical protein